MTGDSRDLAQTGLSRSLPLAVSVLAGLLFLVVLVTGFVGPLLLAGLVALFVVGACVQHPIVGLVLLIALTSTYAFDVGEKDLGIPSMRLLFVVLLLLSCAFSNRPVALTAIPRALLLVGGYGVLLLASVFWARDTEPVLAGAVSLLKILLLVLTVIALTPDVRALRLAVWALVLAGSVLAALSVLQHLTGSFDQNYFGFAKAPVRNIAGVTEAPRVAGPIGDPNSFAQMMVVLVPLALERYLHEHRRSRRVAAGVAALLCGVTSVLTYSRGGLVTLAVVLAVFVIRHPPQIRHVLVMGALLILVVPVVPPSYLQRVATIGQSLPGSPASRGDDGAIQGRTTQMKIAGTMFWDHALVGVGQGNYVVRFPEYNRQYGLPRELGQAPHNLYLEIAAESGLAGLVLWLVIVAAAFRSLAALKNRPVRPGEEATEGLAEGIRLALIALLVNSMFLHGSYPMAFWLLIAISLAAGQIGSEPAASKRSVTDAKGLALPAGG
jgi:O-antigen ligase